MSDTKYFLIFLSVMAIAGASIWITSEITKPKLTDPLAQRLWAVGHTNAAYSSEQAADLVKKTLEAYSDSVKLK